MRKSEEQETWWKIQTGQKRENVHKKSAENVERSTRFLIKAKIQYLFLVSWDAPLRLLSSHSSVLMLNFQNFYITKGPTTSAEKYPASTKSVSQPRPCRGETLAFRQLSAVIPRAHEGGLFHFSCFLRILTHFFCIICSTGATERREEEKKKREEKKKNHGLLWRKHNVSDLPRTCPRRRGRLIYFPLSRL